MPQSISRPQCVGKETHDRLKEAKTITTVQSQGNQPGAVQSKANQPGDAKNNEDQLRTTKVNHVVSNILLHFYLKMSGQFDVFY